MSPIRSMKKLKCSERLEDTFEFHLDNDSNQHGIQTLRLNHGVEDNYQDLGCFSN